MRGSGFFFCWGGGGGGEGVGTPNTETLAYRGVRRAFCEQ